MTIGLNLSQEHQQQSKSYLNQSLNTYHDEHKAGAIHDLSSRGQQQLSNNLDSIVGLLDRPQTAQVKAAVCKSVTAAGPSAAHYCHAVSNLLHDQSADVRYLACIAVGSMGPMGAGVVSKLRMLLSDREESVRFGACVALGGVQATECLEDIKELLTDSSPEVQGAACVALGTLGYEGWKHADDAAERLSDPRSRLLALKALGLMSSQGTRHCEAVVDCLADEDAEVRLMAASVVGKMAAAVKEEHSAFAKVLDLAEHQDGRLRCAAALAIGYMGQEAFEQRYVLKSLLVDNFEEPAINGQTVGGCRTRAPPACRKVKCAAAAALGHIAAATEGEDWAELSGEVGRLLDSPDWEARLCGLEAIAMMGRGARGQSYKVAALFDDDMYVVRAKAALAAGKIRDPKACDGLADLLEDRCPTVREQALKAIAELGEDGDDYTDQVQNCLQDSSSTVRAAACRTLASVGEKGHFYAGAVAQRLYQASEDVLVLVAAMEALERMSVRGASYAEVVAGYLQDGRIQVRLAAEHSLSSMGTDARAFMPGPGVQYRALGR